LGLWSVRIGNYNNRRILEGFVRRYPRARWALTIVLVLLLLVFGKSGNERVTGPLAPGKSGALSGFAKIIDGDSFRLGASEVRLVGIDAPEGRQTCERDGSAWECGEEARRQLQRLIGGQKVSCQSPERDKYGRYLATCEAGGRMLNAAMVEGGYAVSYGRYHREERAAKSARRGLWSGTFQMPRAWRHEHGIGR